MLREILYMNETILPPMEKISRDFSVRRLIEICIETWRSPGLMMQSFFDIVNGFLCVDCRLGVNKFLSIFVIKIHKEWGWGSGLRGRSRLF